MGTANTFDVAKVAEDMAARGWMPTDLAREAAVSNATVSRFLNRKLQTAKTARKIAAALKKPVGRYLVRADRDQVVGA